VDEKLEKCRRKLIVRVNQLLEHERKLVEQQEEHAKNLRDLDYVVNREIVDLELYRDAKEQVEEGERVVQAFIQEREKGIIQVRRAQREFASVQHQMRDDTPEAPYTDDPALTETERLETEEDYIALKRYDFSLEKLLERYQDGVPNHIAAKALKITEAELEARYHEAVNLLRKRLTESEEE
jgi:hypothetical protein